jgi:hypothetical protein
VLRIQTILIRILILLFILIWIRIRILTHCNAELLLNVNSYLNIPCQLKWLGPEKLLEVPEYKLHYFILFLFIGVDYCIHFV